MKSDDQKKPNWRKILWAGVLVAVLAYAYGEPYLEKWLGIDLPSIRENNNVAQVENEPRLSDSSNQSTSPSISSRNSSNTAAGNARDYLTPTGKKSRLQSPAGLVYGVGGGGEHRVDHVMRHAVDDTKRGYHSVFSGSETEILKMLDEAYELVKSKSNRVKSKQDKDRDFRMEHVIDMKRKIGYLGGQVGRRQNRPSRSKLTLILDNGKFVVTAYPDK